MGGEEERKGNGGAGWDTKIVSSGAGVDWPRRRHQYREGRSRIIRKETPCRLRNSDRQKATDRTAIAQTANGSA